MKVLVKSTKLLLMAGVSISLALFSFTAASGNDNETIPLYITIDKATDNATDILLEPGDNATITYKISVNASLIMPELSCSLILDNNTDCIQVTDLENDIDELICYGDIVPGPVLTITTTQQIGPFNECGVYTVANTACIEKYLAAQEPCCDNATVNVDVLCDPGCTLSKGYWKTHSEFGPAPYDETWALVGDGAGADTPFYKSEKSWYEVLWTPPKRGNAYFKLAHQYIAARLNGLSGAFTSAVEAELAEAESLFETYGPYDQEVLNKRGDLRKQFNSLKGVLGKYNNGDIGPGHCDED
jgi:hypothetical protein